MENKQEHFDSFKASVFAPFAKDMADNLAASLEIDPICQAFQCLDPRFFPSQNLDDFGKEDLGILCDWYGTNRRGTFPSEDPSQNESFVASPLIEVAAIEQEYQLYKDTVKKLMVTKSRIKKKEITITESQLSLITKNKNSRRDAKKVKILENKIKDLKSEEVSLMKIYADLMDMGSVNVMPNVMKLLLLANLCPVGNSVVERLFSLLKITKTFLRNRLGDESLDILLRLNKEAPDKWSDNDQESLVELFLKRKGDRQPRVKL